MIIFFTRQLYVLIKAGIPLLRALQIIHLQLPETKFKANIGLIIQDIQEGKKLSEALSSAPRFFSLFYINMIKASEVSGNLTQALKEISTHLIQNRRITRQVQVAFMYPMFVLLIATLILSVLFIFVVPVFVRLFEDLGGALPAATLFLIGISSFIQHWGWLFLTSLLLVIAIIFLLSRQREGRLILNNIIWRIPIFGRVLKIMEIGRFCRILGTILASGVTLTKSLEVISETTESILLRQAIEYIRYGIEQGKTLSGTMEESGIFSLFLVKMIQMGEESGKIAELFSDAAEDYENEVSFAISGLLSLLEPALIVVMGVIVGFIVVSLLFPILTISNLVK